jgi:hypothetical protein
MQGPLRPFESLDWYREAQRGRDEEHPWLSLARSFDAVRLHISLFALGSVLLLAVDLLRSPEHVRADTWVAVWGLLVIMHAVAAGIVTLTMQLMAGDELRPASEVRWDPMRTWTLPAPATEVYGPPVVTEAGPPVPEQAPATPPQPQPPAPTVSGWRAPVPEAAEPAAGERASWQEASVAAWLARHRHSGQDEEAPAADAAPDAPASENGADDPLSGQEPHTRHPH